MVEKTKFTLLSETHGLSLSIESSSLRMYPKTAWEFYIGGYQPAQKWLKDRKGRTLSFYDRMHYRKIIHILMETHRIMKTINMDL